MATNGGQGPFQLTDITNTHIANVSINGELLIANDIERRIQEIMLLIQQSTLLSTQLSKENTSRYNFQEIR